MASDQTSPTHPLSHAAVARLVGAWIQPIFVVALFVLWRVRHWPLSSASEACIAGGVLVYSILNVYAAISSAWGSGIIFAARMARLAGVVIYIVMRYVLHYGFFQSVGVWILLWIVAAGLARKARRRAISAAPLPLSAGR